MKNKLIFMYLVIGAILVIFGIYTYIITNKDSKRPSGEQYLNNLDIKTDNPQPAGKNIAP